MLAASLTWALIDGSDDVEVAERADPATVYDPVAAGEELPRGFFQVLTRDFIEPVYEPEFVDAADAGWDGETDVIGVEIDGEARAYPVSLLNSTEMVVDEIAGTPIVVTWCPLCGTAMVHERVIDGETVVFGVQGALYLNAMTWWDHDTGSVWSQPLGEAIAGPRRGETVPLLASEFTTWDAWRAAHPDTSALDAPGVPTGFDLADLFVVVDFDDDVRAYPISDLREAGVVNDVVAELEIAVVSDPRDPERWAVFSRRVGVDVVELEVVDDVVRDTISGSTFEPARGWGLDGPHADEVLDRLPAFVSLPGGGPTKVEVFDAFWPDGTVWRPD